MTQELKVGVTMTHNGEALGIGFDFSSFLNGEEKEELTAEYAEQALTTLIKSTVRMMRKKHIL